MSYRYGAQLVPGAYHYGTGGLGVLGSLVPSEGTSGPSLLWGDITLPAEADDEFRTLITVPPVGLSLWFVYEDGSFLAEGPDGVYTGTREGFKNGVSYGTATFTLTFGAPTLGGAVTLDDSVAGGGMAPQPPAGMSGSVSLDDATASGGVQGSSPSIEVWEGFALEAGLTPGAMLRIVLAAVAGRTDGVGTDTERYFSVDGSKPRITATFDAQGNRTTIVLDGTP